MSKRTSNGKLKENNGKLKENNGKLKEADEKVLKETYFIPKKVMQRVVEEMEGTRQKTERMCSFNLQELQDARMSRVHRFQCLLNSHNMHRLFMFSCYKALYAQDWNKVLYLLKKVPIWKLTRDFLKYENVKLRNFYPKLQMLLLMFSPAARECGALHDFLHMAWGCRTNSEKRATLKCLLTLLKKIPFNIVTESRALGKKERGSTLKDLDLNEDINSI